MSHPYVTKVTLKDGEIVLTVEFDASAAGQPFEIAGHATQNGGAFANFYDVQVPITTPDNTVVAYVKTVPLQEFKNDENVTVVLRASRVWATVLKQTPADQMPPQIPAQPAEAAAPGAPDGTTWNSIRKVEWVSPAGVPAWNAAPAQAGGASFQPAQPDD
jgi:hypothetical protein